MTDDEISHDILRREVANTQEIVDRWQRTFKTVVELIQLEPSGRDTGYRPGYVSDALSGLTRDLSAIRLRVDYLSEAWSRATSSTR